MKIVSWLLIGICVIVISVILINNHNNQIKLETCIGNCMYNYSRVESKQTTGDQNQCVNDCRQNY